MSARPLEFVIGELRPDLAEKLITHKADVNIRTHIGPTEVGGAQVGGTLLELTTLLSGPESARCMDLLLRHKVDPDEKGSSDHSPLELAMMLGAPGKVRMVLGAKADPTKVRRSLLSGDTCAKKECLAVLQAAASRVCWRSWARALHHPPTEKEPPGGQLQEFFVKYPGLRRLVGGKIVLYCLAE